MKNKKEAHIPKKVTRGLWKAWIEAMVTGRLPNGLAITPAKGFLYQRNYSYLGKGLQGVSISECCQGVACDVAAQMGWEFYGSINWEDQVEWSALYGCTYKEGRTEEPDGVPTIYDLLGLDDDDPSFTYPYDKEMRDDASAYVASLEEGVSFEPSRPNYIPPIMAILNDRLGEWPIHYLLNVACPEPIRQDIKKHYDYLMEAKNRVPFRAMREYLEVAGV